MDTTVKPVPTGRDRRRRWSADQKLCIGSSPPVRKPTSIQQSRKQNGYQQKSTSEPAAVRNIKATIWENTSEKGPCFATTFSRPFKDQSGAWRNGTSFDLNDLEALITVACDTKEWIAAHVLKR